MPPSGLHGIPPRYQATSGDTIPDTRLYCEHMYDFRGRYHNKCTVKLPVRFLGMTDEEILKENHEVAIKALEEQRKVLEDRIAKVSEPINDEIGKIDAKIEALKQESDNENV